MPDQLLPRICQIEQAILNIEKMMNLLVKNRDNHAVSILAEIRDILKQPPKKNESWAEVWLDSYDLMHQFKISRSTLYRWKKNKVLIPSALGKKDMFRKSDIEKLLHSLQSD